jgi:hypothetical protein
VFSIIHSDSFVGFDERQIKPFERLLARKSDVKTRNDFAPIKAEKNLRRLDFRVYSGQR